jgi:CRP/FNR family transcriptional regulator, cyclic AMP receptor protein
MNDVLRSVKIFGCLSDAECEDLVRFMRLRRFEAGQTVLERGKPGDTMLVVAEGALSVVMPGPDRRNVEVARVAVGEVVGEMSCIDPAPRSATVVAAVPTTVYEFGRQELLGMQRLAPGVAAALVGAVIRDVTVRLRRVDERIERELAGHLGKPVPARRPQPPDRPERSSPPLGSAGLGPESTVWKAFLARLRGSA